MHSGWTGRNLVLVGVSATEYRNPAYHLNTPEMITYSSHVGMRERVNC